MTVAILDIESGSVGAGLVRISKQQKPQLFGQIRETLTVRSAPTASNLLSEIEKKLHLSLVHLNTVSARLRQQSSLAETGEIDRIAIFLHAPWATTVMQREKSTIQAHDQTLDLFRAQVRDLFEVTPVTFHVFSSTATPVIHGLFDAPEEALVCSIGGEISELSLLRRGMVEGHATLPRGFNSVLRTLESHAGISRHEALSVISLARNTREVQWAEALTHAMRHITSEMAGAVRSFNIDPGTPQRIFVLAPHPASEWFARMLTEDAQVISLFAPGSTVRPVLPRHATEHMATRPQTPDMPLLLESLFVDTRFST